MSSNRSARTVATAAAVRFFLLPVFVWFQVSVAQGTVAEMSAPQAAIKLSVAGTYESGVFDDSAAEIVAYHAPSARLFVTNASDNALDVLSIANGLTPALIASIDLAPYGAGPNSVAVHDDLVAVAVESDPSQDPGKVVFFNPEGALLGQVQVGALPDMLTFTPDGAYLLVANEGEPDADYTNDPEGSISVIAVASQPAELSSSAVAVAGFRAFNNTDISPVRVFGPGASVAQDLEPEYIAVSADSQTAWVSLQENNGMAIVNIPTATVTSVVPLGVKTYDGANQIDASNRDDRIGIRAWSQVVGMYQPDAIASYTVAGETYLVIANEGDARDYDAFSEEARVGDQGEDFFVDPVAYPNIMELAQDENLGRLKITTATGDTDGDGDIDVLHAYGARSFSILNSAGELVFDSGSAFERITAKAIPENFNSTNDENGSFDNRSDDKGPEPEGITVGAFNGRTYAFIGLERVGGIMVYDITSPHLPFFVQYINNRDFEGDAEAGTAGDLGPEGLLFIPADSSPTNEALLVVTNEVSGTTTTYRVEPGGPNAGDNLTTLTAAVFIDANENGVRDADEADLSGYPVTLFRCGDRDGLVGSAQTEVGSPTSFEDLQPGQYQMAFSLLSSTERFVMVFDDDGFLLTPVRSVSTNDAGDTRGFTSCIDFPAGPSDLIDVGIQR